jgi:signal peptidase I
LTNDSDKTWFRRIVGLPGEVISIDNGNILINGQLIDKSYSQIKAENFEPFTLPSNHYFVIGKKINQQGEIVSVGAVVKHQSIKMRCVGRIWPPHRFGAIN